MTGQGQGEPMYKLSTAALKGSSLLADSVWDGQPGELRRWFGAQFCERSNMTVIDSSADAVVPAGWPSASVSGAGAAELKSSIFGDFINTSILVAATAGIANALASERPDCNPRLLTRHLPPIPAMFAQSYLELCTTTGSHPFVADLATFYSRLRKSRNLLACAGALAEHASRPMPLDLAAVAMDWRQLAHQALKLIDENMALAGIRNGTVGARCELVAGLLAEAHVGGAPCLTAVGTVDLPAWADRRARKRTPKNLQAILLIGGGFQSAVVVDASERGLGVVGLRDVTAGESVLLLIRPGANIAGQIAWVNGPRAGIKLDEPLPAGSRFLAHLH